MTDFSGSCQPLRLCAVCATLCCVSPVAPAASGFLRRTGFWAHRGRTGGARPPTPPGPRGHRGAGADGGRQGRGRGAPRAIAGREGEGRGEQEGPRPWGAWRAGAPRGQRRPQTSASARCPLAVSGSRAARSPAAPLFPVPAPPRALGTLAGDAGGLRFFRGLSRWLCVHRAPFCVCVCACVRAMGRTGGGALKGVPP